MRASVEMVKPQIPLLAKLEETPELLKYREIDKYEIGDRIALTTHAEIYEGVNAETKEPIAFKALRPGQDPSHLLKERLLHQKVSTNPNIVSIDGFGQFDHRPYFVTRLQEHGTLLDKITGPEDTTEIFGLDSVVEGIKKSLVGCSMEDYETRELMEWSQAEHDIKDRSMSAVLKELRKAENLTPDGLVNIFVDAAKEFGHDVDADSPVAKESALTMVDLLPHEPKIWEAPNQETLNYRLHVLRGAANGMIYLHNKGLTHRDIKPGNIGINKKDEGVLIDLGAATRLKGKIDKQWGSHATLSPDAYLGEVNPAIDNYAFAWVVYTAISGRTPLQTTLNSAENYRIRMDYNIANPAEYNPLVDPKLGEVVLRGLNPDPNVRATDTMISAALNLY